VQNFVATEDVGELVREGQNRGWQFRFENKHGTQANRRLGDTKRIAQLLCARMIEATEQKQEIDVGCGAQPALGGTAKQHSGSQIVCERRLRGGDELGQYARNL